MATSGHALVLTGEQWLDRQDDELEAAGAEAVYRKVGSGEKMLRGLSGTSWFRSLRQGDTLMVTELSRLGRSTSQLSQLAGDLAEGGIALGIRNQGIPTGAPSARLCAKSSPPSPRWSGPCPSSRPTRDWRPARARGRKRGSNAGVSPRAVRRTSDLYDKDERSVGRSPASVE